MYMLPARARKVLIIHLFCVCVAVFFYSVFDFVSNLTDYFLCHQTSVCSLLLIASFYSLSVNPFAMQNLK